MTIEQGDYFVVTRGHKCFRGGDPGWLSPTFGVVAATPLTEYFDRSYEGMVFRAIEVCGPAIAAEVVRQERSWTGRNVGDVVSINTIDMELMTVTKAFVEAVTGITAQTGKETK